MNKKNNMSDNAQNSVKSNTEDTNRRKLITENINDISINEDLLRLLLDSEREKRINDAFSKFNMLNDELKALFEDNWIKIKDKEIYYIASLDLLIPDLRKFECSRSSTYFNFNTDDFQNVFQGFKGTLPSLTELRNIFNDKSIFCDGNNIRIKNGTFSNVCFSFEGNGYYQYIHSNGHKFNEGSGVFGRYINNSSINIPIFRLNNILNNIMKFILNELQPEKLSNKSKEMLNIISDYTDKDYIKYSDSDTTFTYTDSFKNAVMENKIDSLNGISFKKEDIINHIKNNKLELPDETRQILADKLLNCEKVRADIEPYDIKRLEDPNLGHWDLWENDSSNDIKVHYDTNFVGRNPLVDIKEDGLIGIDFGTKSTIVVYQDGDDNTQPMRVGMGQYSKKAEAKHYENPTVMEFINLESFCDRYKNKEGRPNTLWEDITVSHTAFNSLIASQSDNYYSYFNDLKQWAGDNRRQVKIKDKNGNERLLPAYVDIKDGEFDPIEIYAYYIGLYINNMHNGIYMHYLLSFPVTYEMKVREKIINSFKRGLKKSLPVYVLHDEEAMKKFRVEQGPSEPAAYAICALEQYGFDPEDDEKVFYGIFDFGGGTTDFDFGIWRSADEDKESRYDYVINHFGAGGDQFLGGENLLELLSFEVFKANQDKLREAKISFVKPAECKKFAGSEVLISDSQEAKLNIKQLMEKLRPLWERHEGYEKLYDSGIIKVNLFDKNGELKLNFELEISREELEKILYERIEKGIKNFFEALKFTFKAEETQNLNKIVIFLAGNSSKSPIVADIFSKYIKEITTALNEKNNTDEQYFSLYPPLGTKEAIEIQKKNGIEVDENDITSPTGKTGVAYGLVEGRDGGVIKVVSEKGSSDEIKFNYYIGRNRKKKFKTIIERDTEYNKWVKFISAEKEDFEFYYTNLPEATTNSLPIKDISKKSGRIDEADENAYVYMRIIEPSVIEYVAATEDEIESNNINNIITRVELK